MNDVSWDRPTTVAVERAVGILGGRSVRNQPLGPLTTYRVGGPAAVFLELQTSADLDAVHHCASDSGLPILVVGSGSNLLIADEGFPGIVVCLGEDYREIVYGGSGLDGGTIIQAGGATHLPILARRCAAAGIGGLEWAVGIPGSVGGGVAMNAGGHGGDMSKVLFKAEIYDFATAQSLELGVEELTLGYRSSVLRTNQIVLGASFTGFAIDPDVSRARISGIVTWRRQHQPGGANAGSVFMNPVGDSAGRLVEAVGCKGFRIRSAQVSPLHANFIQADKGGSAADIVAVISEVRNRVAEATGIELQLECRIVGGAFTRLSQWVR